MYECAHVCVVYPSAMWYISIIEFLTLSDYVIWTYFVTYVFYFCCWFSSTFGTVVPSQIYNIMGYMWDRQGAHKPVRVSCSLCHACSFFVIYIHNFRHCWSRSITGIILQDYLCESCTILIVYYVHVYGNKRIWIWIWIWTFSALLALCAGIHRSPVNSLHKGQWRGALTFSLICAGINRWVNNREAGDLRRHRAHYDVILMKK